jgi:hypothetical protein
MVQVVHTLCMAHAIHAVRATVPVQTSALNRELC